MQKKLVGHFTKDVKNPKLYEPVAIQCYRCIYEEERERGFTVADKPIPDMYEVLFINKHGHTIQTVCEQDRDITQEIIRRYVTGEKGWKKVRQKVN